MKTSFLSWAIAAFTVLAIISCKKEDNTEPETKKPQIEEPPYQSAIGSMKIMVEFMAGDKMLNYNEDIVTENSDTIQVTDLRFFLSNVVLTGEDGDYAIPESYLLVKKTSGEAMYSFTMDSIPAGMYTGISFGLGVDSIANHTNNHSGDLSPTASEGMLWTWDTGYKFLKFEGSYRTDTTEAGAFAYHVGKDANYKTLSFTNPIMINKDAVTMTHFMANILEIFKNPETIDLDVLNAAHGAGGGTLADNYENGFLMLHHVENMESNMDMDMKHEE